MSDTVEDLRPDREGGAGDDGRGLELARSFASLAQTLVGVAGVDETLEVICCSAVEMIDGCDHAGVSLVTGGRITTTGASDPIPEAVDAAQYATGQGPCVDAIRKDIVLCSPDVLTDPRWPDFAAQAQGSGVRSMLAFRLFDDERTLGALNLYADTVDALADGSSLEVGSIFAAHAAAAISAAQTRGNLLEALASRSTIGVAVGLIMARQGVDEDEAFAMLRRASQRTNVKLRDVAGKVAEQHTLRVRARAETT